MVISFILIYRLFKAKMIRVKSENQMKTTLSDCLDNDEVKEKLSFKYN